jgi:phosphopantetheine adenylyltransferase
LVIRQVLVLQHFQQLVVQVVEEVDKDKLRQQEDLLEQMVHRAKEVKVVMAHQVLLVDMAPVAVAAQVL